MREETAEKRKQGGADTSLTTTITLRMPLGLLDVVKRRAPEFGMGYQTFIKALVQQGLFYLNETGSLTLAVESLEEERQWRAQQRAAELEVMRANRKAEKEAAKPTPPPPIKAKPKPTGEPVKTNGHSTIVEVQGSTIVVTPETLHEKVKHTFAGVLKEGIKGSTEGLATGFIEEAPRAYTEAQREAAAHDMGGGGHDAVHIEIHSAGGGGGPLPAVLAPITFTIGVGGQDLTRTTVNTDHLKEALTAFEEEAPTGSKVNTAALRKALLNGEDKLETVKTILPPPTDPPVEVTPIAEAAKSMGAEETAFIATNEARRAPTVAPPEHAPLTIEDIEAMLEGESTVGAEAEVTSVAPIATETSDVDDMMEAMLAGEQDDVLRAVEKDDKPSTPAPRNEPAPEVTDDDLSELLAQL